MQPENEHKNRSIVFQNCETCNLVDIGSKKDGVIIHKTLGAKFADAIPSIW